MTPRQRARRIRDLYARLARIEEERRQIVAGLLPLETEESWSMGFRCVMRGKTLLIEMDRRDAAAEKGRVVA